MKTNEMAARERDIRESLPRLGCEGLHANRRLSAACAVFWQHPSLRTLASVAGWETPSDPGAHVEARVGASSALAFGAKVSREAASALRRLSYQNRSRKDEQDAAFVAAHWALTARLAESATPRARQFPTRCLIAYLAERGKTRGSGPLTWFTERAVDAAARARAETSPQCCPKCKALWSCLRLRPDLEEDQEDEAVLEVFALKDPIDSGKELIAMSLPSLGSVIASVVLVASAGVLARQTGRLGPSPHVDIAVATWMGDDEQDGVVIPLANPSPEAPPEPVREREDPPPGKPEPGSATPVPPRPAEPGGARPAPGAAPVDPIDPGGGARPGPGGAPGGPSDPGGGARPGPGGAPGGPSDPGGGARPGPGGAPGGPSDPGGGAGPPPGPTNPGGAIPRPAQPALVNTTVSVRDALFSTLLVQMGSRSACTVSVDGNSYVVSKSSHSISGPFETDPALRSARVGRVIQAALWSKQCGG